MAVPCHLSPFPLLAELLNQRARLNPHASAVILLPDVLAVPRLQDYLRDQRVNNVRVYTLRGWLDDCSQSHLPVISPRARQLLLVEALLEHPGLFGSDDPWPLADSLLQLFDQLSLRNLELPETLAQFSEQLALAYGMKAFQPQALGREAAIVHTLWRAWRKQLRAEGLSDAAGDYVQRLSASLGLVEPDTHFYLLGFYQLVPAELAWCLALQEQEQLTQIMHGTPEPGITADDYHPDAALHALLAGQTLAEDAIPPRADFSALINSVYALRKQPLLARAQHYAQHTALSPATGRLSIFAAQGAEQEANAIALQVRHWLNKGVHDIGILTEDRRLTRRVRALLERAGIGLRDSAGWALSTTSAATALERWLQCVESDFAQQCLLDLLKSPFVFPDQNRSARLAAACLLERDIIQRHNISKTLRRYREQLKKLTPTADSRSAHHPGELLAELLSQVEYAAQPLLPLQKGNAHKPELLLNALRESLQRLGMTRTLGGDAAGERVLHELDAMRDALVRRSLRMNWTEFRGWLARNLESANFCPDTAQGSVQLLEFAQSPLCQFDALIIAGAEREQLPGAGENSGFFNASVRQQLGLPTAHALRNTRLHHFRRMLECAPRVLITLRSQQDGEAIIASPWVELLQSFHFLAYGSRLENRQLAEMLERENNQPAHTLLPIPHAYPRPQLHAELIPKSVSASSFQQLLDCPYQYFAAQGLLLSAREPVSDTLEKSDYGQRVHLILQAFHGGANNLPGPFKQSITQDTALAATAMLENISQAAFALDLQASFEHRLWLKRWLVMIPLYIEWQLQRETQWQLSGCEISARYTMPAGLTLKGRLDRIDQHPAALAIIDYKSGTSAKRAEIDDGEAIQLPFYALLAQGLDNNRPVERVEYVTVDGDEVKSTGELHGKQLDEMKAKLTQQLDEVYTALRNGASLPAWGDEKTCSRCKMQGICRKQAWVLRPDEINHG